MHGVDTRERSVVFAALVASGEPLKTSEVMTLIGGSSDAARRVVASLQATLAEQQLGVMIEEVAGGYRLVVEEGLVPALAEVLGPRPSPALSSAAVETLALIAYRQPITRGELEAARGANCASVLETLQERELVKVVGRRDVIGQPLLYGTTERFMIEFGLRSLDDLPQLEGDDPGAQGFLRG
ncbi:MAG: SMC-Scp complex subunit ScpB [Trueperaceae bacterium]|nr:MAG: SMC-Scp complex subunit ScpB [Trueperaceae bacterium]